MAIAADEKAAAARIAAFKAGKEPTLTERKELAALRSTKAISAGFVSLSALAGEFMSSPEYGAKASRILDALPHHGKSPIFSAVKADASNGVTLELEMQVPQAVLQDLAAMVPMLTLF